MTMTQNDGLDPSKITFSQAQGYEGLPQPLALEEISYEARVRLWDLLFLSVWHKNGRIWYWNDKSWIGIFVDLHRSFWLRPFDEFTTSVDENIEVYRHSILEDSPINLIGNYIAV